MHSQINQACVIPHLNWYLDWHNLPVRMDTGGVCNGLATVFVKYALQNKLPRFNRLLNQIATLAADADYDEEINEFAKEVAASFLPEERDKRLNQLHAISTLSIDGKPLKSAYDLAMTTNESNWASILKDMQLQQDEAMMVRSLKHTAALIKKDGKYLVYDPNYAKGFKIFRSEEAVIHELRYHVFRHTGKEAAGHPFGLNKDLMQTFINKALNLHVQVIRHPSNQTARTFPNTSQLYDDYLTNQYSSTNMYWAIIMDNKDIVNALYAKGFNQAIIPACIAAANNSTEVLPIFLEKMKNVDDRILSVLIHAALTNGRKEALDILLNDAKCQDCFKNIILMPGNVPAYINHAARGGNEDVLESLLGAYRNESPLPLDDQIIAEKILAGDAVEAAITSQSVACVNFFYQQLKKVPDKLNEELLLKHLLQAIKSNQPDMVRFFIEEIYKLSSDQDAVFDAIDLSTRRVEKTDISILRLLQANQVQFSQPAQAVIDLKAKRPVGFLMPLGIMLYKFSDFIKEFVLKRNEIAENISHFKKMKTDFLRLHQPPETDKTEPLLPNMAP